jgi:hypothetical protein
MHDNRFGIIIFILALIAVGVAVYPGKTTFAGSHSMYKSKDYSTPPYGAADFCVKCHPAEVGNLSTSIAHPLSKTGCICHGYNPNLTASLYDVNLKHNLTKNIYCTNCHTRYNNTGDIPIYGEGNLINVKNQSAHYIYFNKSNQSLVDEVYNRSKRYLEQF